MPKGNLIKNKIRKGKNAVAGTEAATCTSGCNTNAARLLLPINTPTGIVHIKDIANAANTRSVVANAASNIYRYWAGLIVLINANIR